MNTPTAGQNSDILEPLCAIIRSTFGQADAEITRETVALDIDGWDSLSHTFLVLAVEERFGVKLPSDRVFELSDVGELADLVAEAKAQS